MGDLGLVEGSVKWLGLSSVYAPSERHLMSQLSVKEQTIVHALKALTEGTISEESQTQRRQDPEVVYTDPEDIPFGEGNHLTTAFDTPKSKKRRPIYAVVWTPKKHRVHKTKARCLRKQRAWKKWHERNGWKVSSHAAGYFASKGNLRAAITLHEYDAETRQRIA